MRDIILYNFIVYLIHDIVKDERYHLVCYLIVYLIHDIFKDERYHLV